MHFCQEAINKYSLVGSYWFVYKLLAPWTLNNLLFSGWKGILYRILHYWLDLECGHRYLHMYVCTHTVLTVEPHQSTFLYTVIWCPAALSYWERTYIWSTSWPIAGLGVIGYQFVSTYRMTQGDIVNKFSIYFLNSFNKTSRIVKSHTWPTKTLLIVPLHYWRLAVKILSRTKILTRKSSIVQEIKLFRTTPRVAPFIISLYSFCNTLYTIL